MYASCPRGGPAKYDKHPSLPIKKDEKDCMTKIPFISGKHQNHLPSFCTPHLQVTLYLLHLTSSLELAVTAHGAATRAPLRRELCTLAREVGLERLRLYMPLALSTPRSPTVRAQLLFAGGAGDWRGQVDCTSNVVHRCLGFLRGWRLWLRRFEPGRGVYKDLMEARQRGLLTFYSSCTTLLYLVLPPSLPRTQSRVRSLSPA